MLIIINSILFIIIILIYFIIKQFNLYLDDSCKDYRIYNKILYSNAIKQIKTGDLVLFDHSLTSIYERSFGHPQFSHIGIIIKKNNNFYVYDLNPEDYYIKGKLTINKGINLIPLYDRIYNYNGYVFIASLKIPLNNNQLKIIDKFINNNIECNFLSTYKIIYQYLTNNTYIYPNEMVCTELIVKLLDELKLTNGLSKSKKKNLSKNIIELTENKLYYNPVHIILDNLVIKKTI